MEFGEKSRSQQLFCTLPDVNICGKSETDACHKQDARNDNFAIPLIAIEYGKLFILWPEEIRLRVTRSTFTLACAANKNPASLSINLESMMIERKENFV